jgi:hypothetical protein
MMLTPEDLLDAYAKLGAPPSARAPDMKKKLRSE